MSSALTMETAVAPARQAITGSLLEMDERGRAWIKDANTKVAEVALDWIAYGWDAQEIHRQHPHLSLAQIHAALSYYFANQEEMDKEIERGRQEANALMAEMEESPIREKLRLLGMLK